MPDLGLHYTKLQSLTAVTTGNGAVLDLDVPRPWATVHVIANGTVTAGAVQLQGSLDGTHWANIGTAVTVPTTGDGVTAMVTANCVCKYLRAIVSTTVTGGTVTAIVAAV